MADQPKVEAIVCSIHDGQAWFWVADWRADIGDKGVWLTRDKMIFAGELTAATPAPTHGEGTVFCTCNQYPHAPDCGQSPAPDAAGDAVRALVAKWRAIGGVYPQAADELEAALAAAEQVKSHG